MRVVICHLREYHDGQQVYRTMLLSPASAATLVDIRYRGGIAWNEPGRPSIWIELCSPQ